LTHGAASVVPFGGSSSSIFVHAALNSRLPSRPATMPSAKPIGL
jgi:hypothetical protein